MRAIPGKLRKMGGSVYVQFKKFKAIVIEL